MKKLLILIAIVVCCFQGSSSAQALAPLATQAVVSLDGATIISARRAIRRNSTPEQVVTTVTTPIVKEYGFGKLVQSMLNLPIDNDTGMAWLMSIGPSQKLAKGTKHLRLVPTVARDLEHMQWFLAGAADGYNRTILRKFRPLVPEAILNDPDPRTQKDLKRLGRHWVSPHVTLFYAFAPDFGPGSTR